jgi:trimeric autotransporter adhesin
MKKIILFLMYYNLTFTCYSQIGIYTTTPAGMLEVSSGDDAKLGLVLPIVAKLEDVEHAIPGESVKRGTTVFDEQRNTLCHKTITGWHCLNGDNILDDYLKPITQVVVPDYLKASNTNYNDFFGFSIALSSDGNTLAVGAIYEDSSTTGINGLDNNSNNDSGAVYVLTRNGNTWTQQAYIKASNTNTNDLFGSSVALSSNGNTLVVGAIRESSNATGINGDQSNNSFDFAGAVYVFTRTEVTWSQQTYIKASNTNPQDRFGNSVALSSDGNTLAVGAIREASNATGIDGDQTNNSATQSGAVYVFSRDGNTWSQQAYIKASNTNTNDLFGNSVALSLNGNTLVVGANGESSNATGINGNQSDNTATQSGAVYVFTRNRTTWAQQAYIKASNTEANDNFGASTTLSANGNTLVVGANGEDSNATGVNGNQTNNSAEKSGAVYVFTRNGTTWAQQAYIKASNTNANDNFGNSVALSSDGNTLAVGANYERSNATGLNGDETNNSAQYAGAVYFLTRTGTTWAQQAYIKASNTNTNDYFGASTALSANGNILVVGANGEASNATGVNGNQNDNNATQSGATYVYNLR